MLVGKMTLLNVKVEGVKYLMSHQPFSVFCKSSTTAPMVTLISSLLVAL